MATPTADSYVAASSPVYAGRAAPAPAPAPALTFTAGASSGTVGGASIAGPTISAPGGNASSVGWAVSSSPSGQTATPASGTLAPGASVTPTLSAISAAIYAVSVANTSGGTVNGATSPGSAGNVQWYAPTPPPPAPSPAPTGNITQFLTSDGGSAAYTGNFSGPTRDKWHNRLGFAWKRTNTLGNWLDASQVEEGSSAYGTSAAITAVDQSLVITANALVARWLSTGQNRGAYLRVNSGSAFPVAFYGRTDATDANRPKLTVITSTGTFVLTAAANAYWYNSSFTGTGSAAEWRLSSGAAVAILRFDLSTVTGVLSGATLSVKVKSFPSGGSTGQVLGLYECDPPTIIVPENPASPVLGLADGYADFNAWKASGNPALIAADDFELGGPFDGGFTPAATRTLNPDTNTTYARGEITAGANGSANSRLEVSSGTGTQGIPNVVRPEVYGQYWLYLESDFGTTQDDAIKIPAMGVQFGYWVSTGGSTGYWQQTTGNGGTPGTGLKVDRGGSLNYEYQGHSVRFLTGTRPTALDDDPYNGWFGLGIYPYNIDQGGPFPAGEPFQYVAIRPLQQYCVDIRVKQNSMTGSQDALGNYATANADGAYQVWINGVQVYSRTNYRWRKHAEFGVQGVWIDVYHGGTSAQSAPGSHYQLDRVSLATSYIGPKPTPIQLSGATWTPNRNGVGDVLTGDYGQLPANTWVTVAGTDNQITDIREAAVYPKSNGADGFPGVTDAWSSAAWNSTRLELYHSGGGHGDSSAAENGIYCVSATTMKASRVMNRAALATALNWNGSALVSGEGFPSGANYPLSTGYPGSMHTYYGLAWIPPATMTTLGLSAPTRGGLFYPGNARSVINLDTGATTKLWWNRSAPDQSYVTSILDGTTIIQPRADFSWTRWSMIGTETTDWAATSYDPAPGTPSFGLQQSTRTSGTQFVYNSRTFCDMQERRECVSFAFTTTRVRYGAAQDASASDWTSYSDTITLTGAGAADFVSGNFLDAGTNMLNGAGARYDHAAGCIWVMGNRAGDQLYKVTGISTNTWTVTKVAGTGALTTCGQGTFGKFAVFDRGGAKVAIRVSSTSNAIEAMRIVA